MKSLASHLLSSLSDVLKKTMNSPADKIIWRIFDDEVTVSQLTEEEKSTIVAEYGENWVSALGIDKINSQL